MQQQQLLHFFHRRKKTILIAAAVAAGAYASYSYYRSDSFQRRKRQVVFLLDGVTKLLQAAASAADSAALVSGELREFLESGDEECEVPRSIRQLFKILRCPELQELVAAATSSVCKEIVLGVASSTSDASKYHREKPVSYRDRGQFRAAAAATHHLSSEMVAEGWRRDRQAESFEVKRAFLPGSSSKSSRGSHRHEGLPERLLTKLFSESGKGFASVVVGSAVRSLVVSVFQEMENRTETDSESGLEIFELGANGVVRTPGRAAASGAWNPAKLLDLACSTQGRALIVDCIQLFVEASVSTYLEKTQDVHVFEEMVEAVTKPGHQVPAREMIVSVCNGAVDTFVRTTYEVLYEKTKEKPTSDANPSSSGPEVDDGPVVSVPQQQPAQGNIVEKVFSSLAIPSNRKFVMDLAGKVTAEAVRSFLSVLIAISAPYVRISRDAVHSKAAVIHKNISRDAAAKALILVTVCLAVVLHAIANTSISLR